MASVHSLLSNFTAGELSPRLYGRVDLNKYSNGARTVKNFITLPQGGARRRGGTGYVGRTKNNNIYARLEEFTFSTTQSYALEFGAEYIRFFRNRGAIYDVQQNLTGISKATLAVIDVVGHSFSDGDPVILTGVMGMTEVNNREFTIVSSTPDTITINLNTSGYSTYTSGGKVSRIYEVVTSYSATDVADLTFTQSTDTLYIFHPDWPINLLTRTAHAAWTITAGVIEAGPFLDFNTDSTNTVSLDVATGVGIMTFTNDTLVAGHVGALFRIWEKSNGTTFGYAHWSPGATATVSDGSYWEYEGNVYYVVSGGGSALGSTAAYPTHTEGTVSVFYGGGTAEMRYEHSGYCIVQVTSLIDTKNANINVVGKYRTPYSAYGARSSAQWQEGAWSDLRGYPAAGTFQDQRMVTAFTAHQPSTFWGSETGAYLSHKDGDLDTDAFKYSIASDQSDAIRFVIGGKRLAILTASSEYVASGSSADSGITPTNIKVSRETNHGSADVRAIRAGPAILIAQRSGDNSNPSRKIRELVYQFQTDSFVAPDLTILADHITVGGVTSGAFCGSPDLNVWYCRADGQIIGMTYERDQQVVGWHQHVLGGNDSGALVKSVAAIPGVDYDELWMIVERVIDGETVRSIEWVQYGLLDDETIEQSQFLDSSLTYDGSPTSVINGLWHLEGETVDALLDGSPVYNLTISNGVVTLPRAASVVTIGYHYQSLLETLHIEAGAQAGTAQGRIGRVYEVILRLIRSVGGKVGRDTSNLDPIEYRQAGDPISDIVPMFSGDKVIAFDGEWDRDRYLSISTTEPLPLQVTCVMVSQRVSG